MSGDLPGRELADEMGPQFGFRNGFLQGVDHAHRFTASARFDNGQGQAIAHRGMGGECGFDRLGRNLATGDIDDVGGASGDVEGSVGKDAGEVGGGVGTLGKTRIGVGPVTRGDRGTRDNEAGVGSGGDGDAVEGGADAGRIGARGGGGVESDAAAFGGAEEVVDLEVVLVEGELFEGKGKGRSGGDGEPEVPGDGVGIRPGAPEGRNGGQGEAGEGTGGGKDGRR